MNGQQEKNDCLAILILIIRIKNRYYKLFNMSISLTQKKFVSIIEKEREAICDILKFVEISDDVFEKINEMPIPSLPEKRKKKAKSDEPKKVSGYILFSTSFRANKSEGMTSKECISAAGAEWKLLDDDSKSVWNDKATEKYAELVEAYKEKHPEYDPEVKKSEKIKKSSIKVPTSRSAYATFVSEFSKTSIFHGEDLMKAASSAWKELDDDSKIPYNNKSIESKVESKKFMKFLQENKEDLIESGIKNEKKKLEKAAAERWSSMSDEEKNQYSSDESDSEPLSKSTRQKKEIVKIPTKKSAYHFFISTIDKNALEEGQKIKEYASNKWKSMTLEEKTPFVELAKISNSNFEEFKTFLEESKSMLIEELEEELEDKNKKDRDTIINKAAAKLWYQNKN